MPLAAQRKPRPQSSAVDHLLHEGTVTVASNAEALAVFEEWFAREAAKRPTRAQVDEGSEWLSQQEPDEKVSPLCQVYNEALKRVGQEEADRIAGGLLDEERAAPVMWSHAEMVEELRRRVDDTASAFTSSSPRADASTQPAPPARSESRPREHRGPSRRAGSSRDGPEGSDPPPRYCAAPDCGKPLGADRTAAAVYCPGSRCRKAAARRSGARASGKAVDHELIRREALAVKMVEDGRETPERALLALLAVVWWRPVGEAARR